MWRLVSLIVHTSSAKIIDRNGVELTRKLIGPASFSEGAATYIGADVDTGSDVTAELAAGNP